MQKKKKNMKLDSNSSKTAGLRSVNEVLKRQEASKFYPLPKVKLRKFSLIPPSFVLSHRYSSENGWTEITEEKLQEYVST